MSVFLARLPSLEEVRQELAERKLADFIRQAWHVIEPATPYLHNWHIDLICEYLEAVSAGQITRLIINIPPRYMKSIAVSVMWPVWEWIRHPETRWIFASYSQSLSTKHSVDRRTIIQSDWYQSRWGDRFKLVEDHNLKTEFLNDKRGHMIATSVGGTSTGKGGNRLVVDDPLNPKEAASDVLRERANTWFDQTFYSRLDDKKTGAIVVIMQRLHEKDLTGHLLEKGGEWEHLCLPAIAEDRQVIHFPMSGRTLVREPGDLLWPEREGPKEIEAAKLALRSYGFAGQYQQRPSPMEGGIFKRGWWKFYKEPPARFDEMLQSWDCSFKSASTSDYVVGQVWGRVGGEFYLLDQVRDRMDFTETLQAVRALTAKWPKARSKLIEDKANGQAVIDALKREIPGIIPVTPKESKEARAMAVQPFMEAGNVYLPDPSIAPWIHDFIEECAAFPNAAHDDQVDAMTQALNRLAQRRKASEQVRQAFRGARFYG